jgi:hypothetical protein
VPRSFCRKDREGKAYHDESLSLFLHKVFAKNEKANLTKAERNEMRKLLPRLIAGYRKRMAK